MFTAKKGVNVVWRTCGLAGVVGDLYVQTTVQTHSHS